MFVNDPLSDMIARIKNAAERRRSKVMTPASTLRGRVLEVLKDEGYIRGYSLVEIPGEIMLPESNSSISLSAFAAAALISLGLGGNDAQKIMGIIAVLL